MNVLSRMTSRHHWNIVIMVIVIPSNRHVRPRLWNQEVKPIVIIRAPTDPVKGHGLYSTKWKG